MEFLQHFVQDYIVAPSQEPEAQAIHKDHEENKRIKKRVHFESKGLTQRNKTQVEIPENSGIRVKILMTKEEAGQLLSKCKDGGILRFTDVATELDRIPSHRVAIVSTKKHG